MPPCVRLSVAFAQAWMEAIRVRERRRKGAEKGKEKGEKPVALLRLELSHDERFSGSGTMKETRAIFPPVAIRDLGRWPPTTRRDSSSPGAAPLVAPRRT